MDAIITSFTSDTYINPAETGLYYLGSRYYDAEVGRFISADGYLSTGTGLLGYNMYSYCNSNPITRADIGGNYPVTVLSNTMAMIAGSGSVGTLAQYIGLSGIALADGPLPFTDILVISGGLLVTAGVLAAENDKTSIREKEEQVKVVAKTTSSNNQAYFPANPYEFSPKGLIMSEYPGTKNGRIIKWKEPLSKATIFEWNEDFKMGAHYHTLMIEWDGKHFGMHYYPGMAVPEPWNSIYFGGK